MPVRSTAQAPFKHLLIVPFASPLPAARPSAYRTLTTMVSARTVACPRCTQYFLPRGRTSRTTRCTTTTSTFRTTRTTPRVCLTSRSRRSSWSGATRSCRCGSPSSRWKPTRSSSPSWQTRRTKRCGTASKPRRHRQRARRRPPWRWSKTASSPKKKIRKQSVRDLNQPVAFPNKQATLCSLEPRCDGHNETHQNCLNEISFGCSQIFSIDKLTLFFFYFRTFTCAEVGVD